MAGFSPLLVRDPAAGHPWVSYGRPFTPVEPGPEEDTFISTVTIPSTYDCGAGLTRIGHIVPNVVVEGSQIITTPNTVYENITFIGAVQIRAANVTFRNCTVIGRPTATTELRLIETGHASCSNFVAEFCTLIPQAPNSYTHGIGPRNFTIRRSHLQGTVDLVSIYAVSSGGLVNSYVYDNFLEWMTFVYPDVATPSHTDGTHNDAIQYQGGNGGVVRGNFIGGYLGRINSTNPGTYPGARTLHSTAAIMLNNNVGPLTNFLIENNWIGGGVWHINGGGVNGATATGNIRNNTFYGDEYTPVNHINLDAAGSGSANVLTSGNLLIDGVTAATVKRNQ